MEVSQANWHDVEKYFYDTYVKFKETGDTIFRITGVNSEYITATSLQGEEVGIDLKNPYNIDFLLPKKASFNFGGTAYHISRIPARQWKKGISKQNTCFAAYTETGWKNVSFDHALLEGFANKPAYIKAPDLKGFFEQGTKAAAISPRIVVANNGNIFVDTVVVGKWALDKELITTRQLFEVEMQTNFPFAKLKVLK